jgi:hypothetical protein
MPKLISETKLKKLLKCQEELELLKKHPPVPAPTPAQPQTISQTQIDAINQRLNILEISVMALAKVLNPSVQNVEDALATAQRFGARTASAS